VALEAYIVNCHILYFLFRLLLAKLTERNSTKLCDMFESEPDLKMLVKYLGHPSHRNRAPKLYLFFDAFRRRRNLTANFTVNVFMTVDGKSR